MTTFARDIVDLLQSAGLGTEAVDLFEGPLPDTDNSPGAVMSVKPYQGRGSTYNYGNGGLAVTSNFPRAQLLFRDAPSELDAPLARAMSIFDYFDTHFGFVINGHHYPRVQNLQTPAEVGGSQSDGRYVLGFNVEVTRNP